MRYQIRSDQKNKISFNCSGGNLLKAGSTAYIFSLVKIGGCLPHNNFYINDRIPTIMNATDLGSSSL